MGFESYEVGSPYEEFLKALKPLSKGTGEIYRSYLNEFLDFNGSTPKAFYEWVKGLEANPDPRSKKQLSVAFNDFAEAKTGEGLHPNTLANYRKAIHKFLDANELSVRIKTDGKKPRYSGQDTITKKQVKKLVDLSATNLRLRALLMTLKDSGLGVSEVAALTVEDYLSAKEITVKDMRFKQWREPIVRAKTGELCEVCLGPEAIAAIEDYLGVRRRGALFITSKGQPHKDEDGNMDPGEGYTEKGAPITPSAVTSSIRNVAKVLRKKGYKVSAHSFRKLFETSFEIEGKLNTGKIVMGKAVPASDKPYLKLGDNLLTSYAEVYTKHLLLYGESAEIQKLKDEKDKEIAELRAELNQLSQKVLMEPATKNAEMILGLLELSDEEKENLAKQIRKSLEVVKE